MWRNPQFPADLLTFTEEILNRKLHFLCGVGRFATYDIHMFICTIIYFMSTQWLFYLIRLERKDFFSPESIYQNSNY